VAAGEHVARASLADISLREAGFDKPGVEISWRDQDGTWAVHVLDPSAAHRLLSEPPLSETPQAGTLRKAQRSHRAGRSAGLLLLGGLLLVPVVLLVWLVLAANSVAGWVTERIPLEQEVSLGRQAFAGIRSSLNLKKEGAAVETVRSIVAKLTAQSKYRYEVHVAEDPTLNAFAMPGGVVVVHTGLIAATTRAEELAGVLAHEVQHVELRHALRGMVKEMGLRGLWSYATGDFGGTLGGQMALELTRLKFSRDDEREADGRGFDALVAAGVDPAGMPAFFQIMSEKGGDAPASFLSTHPLSEERQRALQQRVDALDRKEFTPLPFAQWPPQ
jgi:predicted Zn-dependent protease